VVQEEIMRKNFCTWESNQGRVTMKKASLFHWSRFHSAKQKGGEYRNAFDDGGSRSLRPISEGFPREKLKVRSESTMVPEGDQARSPMGCGPIMHKKLTLKTGEVEGRYQLHRANSNPSAGGTGRISSTVSPDRQHKMGGRVLA